MKQLSTLVILLLLFAGTTEAQQDPMFTKYMFNTLYYNPAFAGNYEHMYIGLIHRSQWLEIDGAPTTQSFTAHTPLKNERVGVGLAVVNDIIGPTRTTSANLSYAYRIGIGNWNLSIGLQGGIVNYSANWSQVTRFEDMDEAFAFNEARWLPNFGGGVYLSSKHFYIGFSSPHLVEYDLRGGPDNPVTTSIWSKTYRHYYGAMGAAIPINGDNLIFKPSILFKSVGLFSNLRKDDPFKSIGAPNEFDLDLSLLFYEKFWIGASFRTSLEAFTDKTSSYDSADVWVSYFLDNGLRIGAAYDYPISQLSSVTVGAFELMLGYEFYYKTKKTVTPRYF